MSSSVRQRASKSSTGDPPPSPAARIKAEDTYSVFSILEIGRILTLILVLVCATSFFVTKDDLFWNYRPAITTQSFWKELMASYSLIPDAKSSPELTDILQHKTRPIQLTPAQLKKYDGSEPSLPLYLAINGTIYDVSAGRNFYGPGGSYAAFGGADGTRAFVTGCFADDITPDLRGVELMYLPLDDAENDSQYTSGELKKLKEQERRIARREVEKSVKHWVDFFAGSKKYARIGTVKEAVLTEEPWPLCEKARKGRVKRKGKAGGEGGA